MNNKIELNGVVSEINQGKISMSTGDYDNTRMYVKYMGTTLSESQSVVEIRVRSEGHRTSFELDPKGLDGLIDQLYHIQRELSGEQ